VKVGNLVQFNEEHYPKYRGLLGLLTEKKTAQPVWNAPMWVVMVQGRFHPFYVSSRDMTVVDCNHALMRGEIL